jgi:rhamnose utilization protein RhaD (predicted bifunctional aldolase and dehydrogenase)/NAD(P)-dependent dehydrogenase (short-subunit alcohol dehydrogenase family)
MQNLWSDTHAQQFIDRYSARGVGEDLALRVYTSRLIGGDPKLVAHGGGNTSVKTIVPDFLGDPTEVLCVKGSGWDLGDIEPEGLPAVRMAQLSAVRGRDTLSDEDMVAFQRSNLIDPASPNPSVETLLHAYLPHKFVDHSHSTAILSLVDQADGAALARAVYGDRVAIVPYVMAGFQLAKATADAYDANPDVEAIVLLKHGLFTFGETAKQSYDRMIEFVSLAEDHIAAAPAFAPAPTQMPATLASLYDVAPILRGALALGTGQGGAPGQPKRWILDHRTSDLVQTFVGGKALADYGTRGVITPDHNIRLKNRPLVVPAPNGDDLTEFRTGVEAAVAAYYADQDRYFTANNKGDKTQLDPTPRVVFVPGIGLFGVGKSSKEASVAADLAEAMVGTISDAERIGKFEALPEADLFDMEYWSLEQAKLGKGAEKPLQRQVVLVTGGAGAIGAATAKLMAESGAQVVSVDLDLAKARKAAASIGLGIVAMECDVTDMSAVFGVFKATCERFGGVDIVVSNAGAAWQGEIGELDDKVLRQSFELNFFAHQNVAKAAISVMKAQKTGGCLLFNASKQAVNPGAGFGAYGTAKAATLFLSRQYALEYGQIGIRVGAVNADRIRSGLVTDDFVKQRSQSRGISEEDYMAGNLLGLEVTASDVAKAFLDQSLALKTTAGVTTVDGGNIAAALR